jgi:hydrogenase maturation protein HypF
MWSIADVNEVMLALADAAAVMAAGYPELGPDHRRSESKGPRDGHTGGVSERVVRTAVRVTGVVQGVGFRPFVYGLATSLGLSGLVGNDVDGVFAEIEGEAGAVAKFLLLLELRAPPLARIERVSTASLRPAGSAGFAIVPSQAAGQRHALVSADSATCDDCLRELADPADRRYRYPFINCTNCGPRFTIVRDVPYDRPFTTMSGFAMCAACAAEYHDPADRRFHAQPVCCPACGPQLRLVQGDGTELSGDPIAAAASLLLAGRVLAVKGLGGYHLVVDAGNEAAAAALRARKHREDKPFAVMVPDLATAARLGQLDETTRQLLASSARPIVLCPRQSVPVTPGLADGAIAGSIAAAVAPGNRQLGLLLPYTGLHHLLLAQTGRPLVATSGNVSDEPIAYRDADALARLAGIADAFLLHDRPIHVRTDDSVLRVSDGRPAMLRRARGYAPEPVRLRAAVPRPVLACGAELKSTFCLAAGDRAFISQHIGDLENAETLQAFTAGIEHYGRLFDISPRLVAHDLHPDYLSTKYAMELEATTDGLQLTGVQHHHAHIASCLADNGVDGPVIGVALDGTGYGTDGTIWGGEFLVADLAGFERVAALEAVPMPGGAAAIRQPWRMAAVYLAAAYPGGVPAGLAVRQRNEPTWDAVTAMAARGVNAPLTSSAGRLFDAAAALLGVRDAINYEGQAAVELEQLADPAEGAGYPATLSRAGPGPASGPGLVRIRGADLIAAAAADLMAGTSREVIAARFHLGVADAVLATCAALRAEHALGTVALSGGVFQNVLLTTAVRRLLRAAGFTVLTHSQVPCNDGGISLGQAVVAAARDRQGLL